MIIDTQCHVFPRKYADFLQKHASFPRSREEGSKVIFEYDEGIRLAVDFERYDRDAFLGVMESDGVTLSLISCNIPDPGVLPKELEAEACAMINDEIAAWVRAYPDKFQGIASIPWNVPEASAAEVRRAKALGLKGVQLLTQNGGLYVDDPALEPAYSACEECDMPIFIHPTVPTWSAATAAYGMTATAGFPMDTSLACIRLVYGGVLDRWPGLRFHQPHAGGVLPWLDGRLSYRAKGVAKPLLKDGLTVRDYITGGRFWFDACNPSSIVLRLFREYLGADRLMFATDYPFLSPRDLLKYLGGAGFTDDETEAVLWKNANEFYKLGIRQ